MAKIYHELAIRFIVNESISNVHRVTKFTITADENSEQALAKCYQAYPYLMLYSVENSQAQVEEAEKLKQLFDEYKDKNSAINEIKEEFVIKEIEELIINESKDIDNSQNKELSIEKLTIFQKALEKLVYFNETGEFSKKLDRKSSEVEINNEVDETSYEYYFESLCCLLIDGNNKTESTGDSSESENKGTGSIYNSFHLGSYKSSKNDPMQKNKEIRKFLGCNENEKVSDKNLLTILKKCLENCKDVKQAKHYIKLAVEFVKLGYKELSVALFNSLPEGMKIQHAELGLLGFRTLKNIQEHFKRLTTDHGACLALIALGHLPQRYERNLLFIILSNPSPIMVWRAVEQLAKIYPHIKKIIENVSILDMSGDVVKELLSSIYAINGDLLIQTLPIIKELEQLHQNNKLSLLQSNTIKTRIDCILSNKKEANEVSVVFITFNKCLLENYSINKNNKNDFNESNHVEQKDLLDDFIQCLFYEEFGVVVEHILPHINKFYEEINSQDFKEIINKHFDFYLRKLSEELCSEKNKNDQSKFIEALNHVKLEKSEENISTSLEKFCGIENNETKGLSISLRNIFLIIKSIHSKIKIDTYNRVGKKIIKKFNKILEQLVSEQLLDQLNNDYLPEANAGEAANAISNILVYDEAWLDRIVKPLEKEKLIESFFTAESDKNPSDSKKMLGIFEIITKYKDKNKIDTFSNRITEIIIAEINIFMQDINSDTICTDQNKVALILLKLQYLVSAASGMLDVLLEYIIKKMEWYVKQLDVDMITLTGCKLVEYEQGNSEFQASASELIDKFFKDAKNQLFDKKTASRDYKAIMEDLEIEDEQEKNREINKPSNNTQLVIPKLLSYKNNIDICYGFYQKKYNVLYQQMIDIKTSQQDSYLKYNEIMLTVGQISKTFKLDIESFRAAPDGVGYLIANIFAMWTYRDIFSKTRGKGIIELNNPKSDNSIIELSPVINENSKSTTPKVYGRHPHAAQIISILLMLGMDDNKRELQHRLLQVGTGEGKSIALAGTAAVFGLLGYDAHVACYHQHLATRDKTAFEELFTDLDVNDKVNYGDLKHWAEVIIKEKYGSPRDKFINYMKQNVNDNYINNINSNMVLLIDEADVFFSGMFLGKIYNPGASLKSTAINTLLKTLWQDRDTWKYRDSERLESEQIFTDIFTEYPKLKIISRPLAKAILNDLFFVTNDSYKYEIVDDNICELNIESSCYRPICFGTVANGFIAFKEEMWNANSHANIVLSCGKISFLEMLKHYKIKVGMSGTLFNLSEFQNSVLQDYGIKLNNKIKIPSTFQKETIKREAAKICPSENDYFEQIKLDIEEKIKAERAVLVFFDTEDQLIRYQEYIKKNAYDQKFNFNELLDGTKMDIRDTRIKAAAKPGMLTLAVRSYGRGTDFICHSNALVEKGGVHIILTFLPDSQAEYVQIEGRTCRQDNPGTIVIILSRQALRSSNIYFANCTPTQEEISKQITYLENKNGNNLSSEIKKAKEQHEEAEEIINEYCGLRFFSTNKSVSNNSIEGKVVQAFVKWNF